jgi:hypothetical protein
MSPRIYDNVTVGEVARSVDELKTDVREVNRLMREHIETVPERVRAAHRSRRP